MKTLAVLILLLSTFIVSAEAAVPVLDDGLYRGVITVQRSFPGMKTVDTVTLLINAEVFYSRGNGGGNAPLLATIIWTARNHDSSAKLANAWSYVQLGGSSQFPAVMPDMAIQGTNQTIYGGPVIPGSYKNTRTSISWKCTKETTLPFSRKSIITTSFSISRIGPLPAATANP